MDIAQLRYPVAYWDGTPPLHRITCLALTPPRHPLPAHHRRGRRWRRHQSRGPGSTRSRGSTTGELVHWEIHQPEPAPPPSPHPLLHPLPSFPTPSSPSHLPPPCAAAAPGLRASDLRHPRVPVRPRHLPRRHRRGLPHPLDRHRWPLREVVPRPPLPPLHPPPLPARRHRAHRPHTRGGPGAGRPHPHHPARLRRRRPPSSPPTSTSSSSPHLRVVKVLRHQYEVAGMVIGSLQVKKPLQPTGHTTPPHQRPGHRSSAAIDGCCCLLYACEGCADEHAGGAALPDHWWDAAPVGPAGPDRSGGGGCGGWRGG